MEIPKNEINENDKVEKACADCIEAFKTKDSFTMCWSDYPEWVAREVARRFIARGYHAVTIDHMRGNGPSWFWYGIEISKYRQSGCSYPKSDRTVLG